MTAIVAVLARRSSGAGIAMAAAGIIGALLATVVPAKAAAAELSGTWSGSGTVTLASGAKEKTRCRATYNHAGGRSYAMSATCATSSAKVSQTAILSQNTANRFGGTFYNPEFGVTGRIRVILSGKRQTVYLTGGAGYATISMQRQ